MAAAKKASAAVSSASASASAREEKQNGGETKGEEMVEEKGRQTSKDGRNKESVAADSAEVKEDGEGLQKKASENVSGGGLVIKLKRLNSGAASSASLAASESAEEEISVDN